MEEKKKIRYKFTNALMFAIVMRDEELCTGLLQRIIPERKIRQVRFPETPLVNLKYLETEKTLIPGIRAKSVRLDVLFEDSDVWYIIEMQVQDTRELPKRSRYYHASLDTYILQQGQHFSKLKPCYVIFICLFDLFGRNEPMYQFQMIDEKNHLLLENEQYTLILNAECPLENCPAELQTFYAYLKDGTVADDDVLIQKIHQQVEQANQIEEVQNLMTLQEEMDMQKEREETLKAQLAEAEAARNEAEAARHDMEAELKKLRKQLAEAEARAGKAAQEDR